MRGGIADPSLQARTTRPTLRGTTATGSSPRRCAARATTWCCRTACRSSRATRSGTSAPYADPEAGIVPRATLLMRGRDGLAAEPRGCRRAGFTATPVPAVDVALTPFPHADEQRAWCRPFTARSSASSVACLRMRPGTQVRVTLWRTTASLDTPSRAAPPRPARPGRGGAYRVVCRSLTSGTIEEARSLREHDDPNLWDIGEFARWSTGRPRTCSGTSRGWSRRCCLRLSRSIDAIRAATRRTSRASTTSGRWADRADDARPPAPLRPRRDRRPHREWRPRARAARARAHVHAGLDAACRCAATRGVVLHPERSSIASSSRRPVDRRSHRRPRPREGARRRARFTLAPSGPTHAQSISCWSCRAARSSSRRLCPRPSSSWAARAMAWAASPRAQSGLTVNPNVEAIGSRSARRRGARTYEATGRVATSGDPPATSTSRSATAPSAPTSTRIASTATRRPRASTTSSLRRPRASRRTRDRWRAGDEPPALLARSMSPSRTAWATCSLSPRRRALRLHRQPRGDLPGVLDEICTDGIDNDQDGRDRLRRRGLPAAGLECLPEPVGRRRTTTTRTTTRRRRRPSSTSATWPRAPVTGNTTRRSRSSRSRPW